MLTTEDMKTLEAKGVSQSELEAQIERFKTGFPFLKIANSAQIGNGIMKLTPEEEAEAVARWKKYLADGGEVCKFVPASGAASRMFKSLFSFVEGEADVPAEESDVAKLIADIHNLAFIGELNDVAIKLYSKDVDALIAEGEYKKVIAAIILPEGLNYGNLPKGLLTFHAYADGTTRTPVEEQLVEGAQSATGADGVVHLHFTVSGNHRQLFADKLAAKVPALEEKMGVKFDISMSEQKASTDTVAVNPDNTLFRENGSLVFRPGGHGALIANLNDIDSAAVFIKNIDNVVPDSFRDATLQYKQVIAGCMMQAHDKIEEYLRKINEGNYTIEDVREMIEFLHKTLNVRDEQMKHLEDVDLVLYIKNKLDRPLRVCGMVRNEGEPGGGPYIAYNADGSTSPQILESHQIDLSRDDYKAMMAQATHFNPVDLVCYIKDIDGNHYDLPKYVDPATGFISNKSLHGKELRALELPGLWNGAMSDWNTIFVEVPIETFNPVKTVNDLLRPTHQG
ncbi:MAG: DUF4301 family protein [Muribaculaceae bacterium]|nr:DUF4301 family protein [Muribaculaceae bacterium]